MQPSEIESILRSALALDEVHVSGEGGHYQVIAVASLFDGIYAPLMEQIASNAIHALSIKAFTPAEWQRNKKLIMPS